jgi:hypothetical protein
MRNGAVLLAVVLLALRMAAAQNKDTPKARVDPQRNTSANAPPRVSLAPRFSPGQSFRYKMVFETTTAASRSGLASDPQGPSKRVMTWEAEIRLEVLPALSVAPGAIRLRTTYEKSNAELHSDTFEPEATALELQYKRLEGKVLQFTLDADGKVISTTGLEAVASDEKSLETARASMAQLTAGPGAPAGGVTVGQKWSSEQAAESLPISGLVWRTASEYMRDEPCPPASPAGAPSASGAVANAVASETCAVIASHLELVRPKRLRDPTPEEYRKNGVRTGGTWDGSGENISYVSLRTGQVVRMTQTDSEQMDVTFTTSANSSLHYIGTTQSRLQVDAVELDKQPN